MLVAAVVGQYVATLFGSNGLVLLTTDNERRTSLLHAAFAIVVFPSTIVAVLRHWLPDLGGAYLFPLVFNDVTESWLPYRLEDVRPFTIGHWLLVVVVTDGTVVGGPRRRCSRRLGLVVWSLP